MNKQEAPPRPVPVGMKRVSARDLYAIRRAYLGAEVAAIKAQSAQRAFEEILLEMERKYGLLATDSTLDARTGEISEAKNGPA